MREESCPQENPPYSELATFTSFFVPVSARLLSSQFTPSVHEIDPSQRGNSISQKTTATYDAKTEYHRDTSLLGISTENREFQDKEK